MAAVLSLCDIARHPIKLSEHNGAGRSKSDTDTSCANSSNEHSHIGIGLETFCSQLSIFVLCSAINRYAETGKRRHNCIKHFMMMDKNTKFVLLFQDFFKVVDDERDFCHSNVPPHFGHFSKLGGFEVPVFEELCVVV